MDGNKSLFAQLTRLFKSGPVVRRKIRPSDKSTGAPAASNGTLLFQRSQSPTYSSMINPTANIAERLARYNDFNDMEQTPEISTALDVYADESVSVDEHGRVMHIFSEDEKIRQELEELFYNIINTEFNLRAWIRNLVKFGDFFAFIDVVPGQGIRNVFPIPVNECERQENYDINDIGAVRFHWTMRNKMLENWEVAHCRLLGNDAFIPYGTSVLEGARRIWRQMILAEDAMLVYRITRAPERRVFYIDVGNLNNDEIKQAVEEQKRVLRTNTITDPNTGKVDLRFNPFAIDEDYFIPRRSKDSGTEISTLAGGQNTAAIEDVAYFQKKLFSALKIPRAYLGYDEDLSCLVGSTKIPLLNGTTTTIEELSALDWDKLQDVWVYSCTPSGAIVPGRVNKAWQTKGVTTLYKVTLDDGAVVECTENHPFMLRDGTYLRADELSVGQPLMPLYRKLSLKEEKDFQNGYEKIFDNETKKWEYTHRAVARNVSLQKDASWYEEKKRVIHHVDIDKRNNNPQNLLHMGRTAHTLYHANNANVLLTQSSRDALRRTMKTSDYIAAHLQGVEAAWARDINAERSTLVAKSNKLKRKNIDIDEANILAKLCTSRKEFLSRLGVSYSLFAKALTRQGVSYLEWFDGHFGPRRESFKLPDAISIDELRSFCVKHNVTAVRQFEKHHKNSVQHMLNVPAHSIIRAINNAGFPTWSEFKKTVPYNHKVLSIEIVELDEPVYVYDLEVERYHNFVVQGATNTENSFSGCVVVHNSKAALSQLDIRFSRTVSIIQKTIIAEMNKIAAVHLFARGYRGEDLMNFTLALSNPSTIAKQQKLELMRTRMEIAGMAAEGGVVSKDFIRREIFDFTDRQCKKMDNDRYNETIIDKSLEELAIAGGGGEGGDDEGGGDFDFGGGDTGGGDELTPDIDAGGEDEGGGDEGDVETAGELPDEDTDPNLHLLTGGDDPEKPPVRFTIDKKQMPVKITKYIDRMKHNRSRLRHHGASKTHMPDFARMTGVDTPEMLDPYDDEYTRSVVTNPFGESYRVPDIGLSPDIRTALEDFDRKHPSVVDGAISSGAPGLLREIVDDEHLFTFDEDTEIIDDEQE